MGNKLKVTKVDLVNKSIEVEEDNTEDAIELTKEDIDRLIKFLENVNNNEREEIRKIQKVIECREDQIEALKYTLDKFEDK